MQKNKTEMSKKRIYISGPISGLDRKEVENNFSNVDLLLRKNGFSTFNPTNVLVFKHPSIYRIMQRVLGPDLAYRLVLCYDLVLLSRSDALCLIDGWQQSRGARIEENFAFRVGIPKTYCYDPKEKKLTQRNEQSKKNRKHKKQ